MWFGGDAGLERLKNQTERRACTVTMAAARSAAAGQAVTC
jgi:hypothetical protein